MNQRLIEFYNKLKTGVLRTFSANVINKAVGLISSMAITRILSTTEYGVWSYVLNLYSYLAMITGFGLISGVLQFGAENKGEGKAYSFFKYCTKTGLLLDFIIVTVFASIVVAIQLPIEGAKPFVLVFLPILLVEYANSIGQCILRAQNKIKEYANVLNVNTILVAVGTCCGALFGLRGVVVGRYFAYSLSIIYLISLLKNDIVKIVNADILKNEEKKQLWHYSLFTGASSAMNCIMYSLDITLIAALIRNAKDVAIYRAGTLIPNALQFIPSSVIVAVLPTIIYNRNELDWVKKNTKRIFGGLFVLNTFIVGVLFIASPLIIRIISGDKYLASVPVLRILALGYFCSGTFRSLSVNLLAAFRRVHFGLFIAAITCILDISLNYYFIKWYGMIGAAYATLFVDVITAVISFGYVNHLLRKGTINEIN